MTLRYDLSGTLNDYTIKLVVAIDTSGSIGMDNLIKVLSEIFEIVRNKKSDITLIQCDSEIKSIDKIKSLKDIKLNLIGGGGTFFTPVIEYLNKNNYYKGSILIYFTDGYGEKEIPKSNIYRLLLLVLKDKKKFIFKRNIWFIHKLRYKYFLILLLNITLIIIKK